MIEAPRRRPSCVCVYIRDIRTVPSTTTGTRREKRRKKKTNTGDETDLRIGATRALRRYIYPGPARAPNAPSSRLLPLARAPARNRSIDRSGAGRAVAVGCGRRASHRADYRKARETPIERQRRRGGCVVAGVVAGGRSGERARRVPHRRGGFTRLLPLRLLCPFCYSARRGLGTD